MNTTRRIQHERSTELLFELIETCLALLNSPGIGNAVDARQSCLLAVLDRIDLNDSGLLDGYSFALTRHISNRAFLARQLSRPGCVGVVRQALLLRLEELAFPPTPDDVARSAGLAAVAGLLAPQTNVAWSLTLAAARAPRQRHFLTVWDAVAWLKKHHPEIDLDAPPPPVRRGP
jgi:hypothetical protein